MNVRNPNVLVSGAGLAGSVLAHWLQRYGFEPTVVERAPTLRKTGGHALDLWGAAVDIVEWMGLLAPVEAARTRNEVIAFVRPGKPPIRIDEAVLAGSTVPGRHIEVMRDDLTEILHEGTRDRVEYVFGDSVTSLEEDAEGVKVTFEHGSARNFDLVVGADGLHSGVRRLVFGEEARFRRYLGGYLCVYTGPNLLGLDGELQLYSIPGRIVATYPVRGSDQARVVLTFQPAHELDVHHRDTNRQKQLVREAFAGAGWEVPRLLEPMAAADDFYFDSISQIRLDPWSRGRVTLVGDAGYAPAPAVGGGSSLAVVAAYVLAGELAAAGGDHTVGFPAYEHEIGDIVRRSHRIGPALLRSQTPRNRFQAWLAPQLVRLLPKLPRRLRSAATVIPRDAAQGLTAVSTFPLKDYPPAR